MAKKYTIYHGTTPIVPADSRISQIYHGGTLIWERAAETAMDYVYEVAAAAGLASHIFTKSGLLIPQSFTRAATSVIVYEATTGESREVDVSAYAGTVSSGIWQAIWADAPTYYNNSSRGMLIFSSDMSSAVKVDLSPAFDEDITQTEAKNMFLAYTSDDTSASGAAYSYVNSRLYKLYARGQAYGGVIPFTGLVGILEGSSAPDFLAYMDDDGAVHTSADFLVLDATADGLICAETPTLSEDLEMSCRISLRDTSGTLIKYLTDDALTVYDSGNVGEAYWRPYHDFNLTGDWLLCTHSYMDDNQKLQRDLMRRVLPDGEEETVGTNSTCKAYEVDVARDLHWYFGGGGSSVYRDVLDGESEDLSGLGMHAVPLVETDTAEEYSQYVASTSGGNHYTAEDGENYILATYADGKTDDDGNEVYALLRVGRTA